MGALRPGVGAAFDECLVAAVRLPGAGRAGGAFARPPAGIVQGLNWWVLNIALPALVLELIPRVQFDRAAVVSGGDDVG